MTKFNLYVRLFTAMAKYFTEQAKKHRRLISVRLREYYELKAMAEATASSYADLIERAIPFLKASVLPGFLEEPKKESKFSDV